MDSQDVGQHTDAATQDSAESSSCAGDNDPVIRLGMSTNTLYQSVSQIRLSPFSLSGCNIPYHRQSLKVEEPLNTGLNIQFTPSTKRVLEM